MIGSLYPWIAGIVTIACVALAFASALKIPLLEQIPVNVRIFFAVIVGLTVDVGLLPWMPRSTPVTASDVEWNHWARIATADPRAAASEIVQLQLLSQRCAVPSPHQPADPLDPGAAATEIVRLHAQVQRCSPQNSAHGKRNP